jgi:hypothetical protein
VAATVGGYVVVRLLIAVFARPHYLPTTRLITPVGIPNTTPPGSWIVRDQLVDGAGRSIDHLPVMPCANVAGAEARGCLRYLGFRVVTDYHPASQYWSFQLIESGIFLGLAAVLVAVAFVVTLRRDA